MMPGILQAMCANTAAVRVLEKAGLQRTGEFDFDSEQRGILYKIRF